MDPMLIKAEQGTRPRCETAVANNQISPFEFLLISGVLCIHTQCVTYGTDASGYVDYVKGANIAGFVKVADAMIDQGVV